MRIALRMTLLSTCAAVGVALAISLVEVVPHTYGDDPALAEFVPSEPTSGRGESLPAGANAPEGSLQAGQQAPRAADRATIRRDWPPSQASAKSNPLRSNARSAEAAAQTNPLAAMAPAPTVMMPYQSALTQELDDLQRTIRDLQDSREQQTTQLRETIDWLKELPLPVNLRSQLEQVPAVNSAGEQAAGPASRAAPAGQASSAQPARYRQEIQAGEGDNSLRLNLQNADLREVLDLLGQQFDLSILPSRNVQGQVSASINNVDVESALNAILRSNGFSWRREGQFIYVGTRADLDEIDRDRDRIATRVYRPNYVTAAEIQNLITNMLTPTVGAVTVSSAAEIDIPADNVHTGGDSFGGQDVVLVRDYETVLLQIDQVVQEIDIRPLQVAIEAMILSVELDDSNQLGVNFELLRQSDNVAIVSGSGLEALADLTFDGGLKVGFLDSNLAGFITALERVGQTNVIAKPHLMCLNKQRAEILIGEQLGYVSTTVTENAATQSVEFLEVGTQLRIRPFISSDGMIRMEVHPELSTGNVRVEQNFTLPDKDVTQVTTNIMCRDGATIVIGGLIREDLAQNNSQIPLLGSLPYLGAVFRQQDESTKRQELIVLITPRIICEPEAYKSGENLAQAYHQHQADFADKMSPLGKRYWGRQYLRKARAAWNAGDPLVALRYANLSMHFDPQNIEAGQLREEIVAVSGVGDQTIHQHLKEGLPVWQHPLREYSREGHPWKSPPPEEYLEGMPMFEHEVGQHGAIRTIEPPRRPEEVFTPSAENLPSP